MCDNNENKEEALDKYYNESVKEFIKCLRKGPPTKYRWLAWKTALHINEVVSKDIYTKLITPEAKDNVEMNKR